MKWIRHMTILKLQRGFVVGMIILLLWLIFSKVMEVMFEPKEVAVEGCTWHRTGWSFVEYLGYGVARRLKDVEFWVWLAIAFSSHGITRATGKLAGIIRATLPSPPGCRWRIAAAVTTVIVFGVGLCVYISEVKADRGTFYWRSNCFGEHTLAYDACAVLHIRRLQNIEGVVECIFILIAAFFLGRTVFIAAQVRMLFWKVKAEVKGDLVKVCDGTFSALLMPFLGATFFFAASKLISETLKLVEIPLRDWARILGVLIACLLPYLAVFTLCRLAWWSFVDLKFCYGIKLFELSCEPLDSSDHSPG